MSELLRSTLLLLVLLNPFLVIVYLIDVVQKLDQNQFQRVLLRAGLISTIAFCCFAILGDTIFSNIFQVEFASFQYSVGLFFFLLVFNLFLKDQQPLSYLEENQSTLLAL